jgi:hypothetical protein
MKLSSPLPTRSIAFAISGMVFSCTHILATCSYGNGRLVARLRFAERAAFFGFVDALDNNPPLGIESWDNLRGGVGYWSGRERPMTFSVGCSVLETALSIRTMQAFSSPPSP